MMKKVILKISAFMLCAIMVFSLCSCGEEIEPPDISECITGEMLKDGDAVENENYKMEWNDASHCVVFTDKKTGAKWSTSPADYLNAEKKEAGAKTNLESPLFLEYFNVEDGEEASLKAYSDSISDENFDAEIDGNTITVGYYFMEANAYIPIQYILEDDHFSIAIDADKIVEAQNALYTIKLAPYFCSVKTGKPDTYLFYPSGSGAIIDTSNPNLISVSDLSDSLEHQLGIYGPDAARKTKEKLTNDKNVYLPVFGAKDGNNALMGVVSSGEESFALEITTNESSTGYSAIIPKLFIRGYDYNTIRENNGVRETKIYSKDPITNCVFKIDFYTLSGDQANYNGMAKKYQSILFGDNKSSDIKESAFSLKIAGGLMQEKDFLGYPYQTLLPLTTFKDVENMMADLKDTGVKPNVQMYGFGESGLDVGEVAGGFALGSEFGSKADIKKLIDDCKNDGIDTFVDFNLTAYNSTGGGYWSMFDSAKTANQQAAYQYYLSKSVQTPEEKLYDRFRLLKRDGVISAADKLLGKIDKYGISGVSFASLSDTAYSDYNNPDYYVKKNFGKMVQDIVASYKEKGHTFAANGANAYAAKVADCIFESPLNSSEYEIFAYDVPFYQMVFKGKVEMTSEAVNSGESLQKKELQALESGSSMLFTVYQTYKSELSFSPFKNLYGGVYNSNRQNIKDVAAKYKDYYEAISGQTIAKHEVISDTVRATTFSNGVKIYVNYGEKDFTSDAGNVKAMDCLIVK